MTALGGAERVPLRQVCGCDVLPFDEQPVVQLCAEACRRPVRAPRPDALRSVLFVDHDEEFVVSKSAGRDESVDLLDVDAGTPQPLTGGLVLIVFARLRARLVLPRLDRAVAEHEMSPR